MDISHVPGSVRSFFDVRNADICVLVPLKCPTDLSKIEDVRDLPRRDFAFPGEDLLCFLIVSPPVRKADDSEFMALWTEYYSRLNVDVQKADVLTESGEACPTPREAGQVCFVDMHLKEAVSLPDGFSRVTRGVITTRNGDVVHCVRTHIGLPPSRCVNLLSLILVVQIPSRPTDGIPDPEKFLASVQAETMTSLRHFEVSLYIYPALSVRSIALTSGERLFVSVQLLNSTNAPLTLCDIQPSLAVESGELTTSRASQKKSALQGGHNVLGDFLKSMDAAFGQDESRISVEKRQLTVDLFAAHFAGAAPVFPVVLEPREVFCVVLEIIPQLSPQEYEQKLSSILVHEAGLRKGPSKDSGESGEREPKARSRERDRRHRRQRTGSASTAILANPGAASSSAAVVVTALDHSASGSRHGSNEFEGGDVGSESATLSEPSVAIIAEDLGGSDDPRLGGHRRSGSGHRRTGSGISASASGLKSPGGASGGESVFDANAMRILELRVEWENGSVSSPMLDKYSISVNCRKGGISQPLHVIVEVVNEPFPVVLHITNQSISQKNEFIVVSGSAAPETSVHRERADTVDQLRSQLRASYLGGPKYSGCTGEFEAKLVQTSLRRDVNVVCLQPRLTVGSIPLYETRSVAIEFVGLQQGVIQAIPLLEIHESCGGSLFRVESSASVVVIAPDASAARQTPPQDSPT